MVSSATLTIVPSRKTIPEPRTTVSRMGPRRTFIAPGGTARARTGCDPAARGHGAQDQAAGDPGRGAQAAGRPEASLRCQRPDVGDRPGDPRVEARRVRDHR